MRSTRYLGKRNMLLRVGWSDGCRIIGFLDGG